MITADEARQLNPDNAANKHLDAIYDQIRVAAVSGKTSIRFPYELTSTPSQGAVVPLGAVGHRVAKTLESLGFKLVDHWDERQFVDAYITVEW